MSKILDLRNKDKIDDIIKSINNLPYNDTIFPEPFFRDIFMGIYKNEVDKITNFSLEDLIKFDVFIEEVITMRKVVSPENINNEEETPPNEENNNGEEGNDEIEEIEEDEGEYVEIYCESKLYNMFIEALKETPSYENTDSLTLF